MSPDVLKGIVLVGAFPVLILLFGWLLLSQSRFFTLSWPVKTAVTLAVYSLALWIVWALLTAPEPISLVSMAILVAPAVGQLSADPAGGWLRWPGRLIALALYATGVFIWLRENPPFADNPYDTGFFLIAFAVLIGMAAWEAYRRLRAPKTDNAPTTGTGIPS